MFKLFTKLFEWLQDLFEGAVQFVIDMFVAVFEFFTDGVVSQLQAVISTFPQDLASLVSPVLVFVAGAEYWFPDIDGCWFIIKAVLAFEVAWAGFRWTYRFFTRS